MDPLFVGCWVVCGVSLVVGCWVVCGISLLVGCFVALDFELVSSKSLVGCL